MYPSYLIFCNEFALPMCAWHVMDGQPQIMCAVLKVQRLWLIQKLSSHLGLHLKNLLHKTPHKEITTLYLLSRFPSASSHLLDHFLNIRECIRPLI